MYLKTQNKVKEFKLTALSTNI